MPSDDSKVILRIEEIIDSIEYDDVSITEVQKSLELLIVEILESTDYDADFGEFESDEFE